MIRVLRILEYTYTDHPETGRSAADVMADDIASWHVGAVNVVRHSGVTIRSSTMLPESIPDHGWPGGPPAWFEAIEVVNPGQAEPDYIVGDLRRRSED